MTGTDLHIHMPSPPPRVEAMAGLAKGLAIVELFSGGAERLTVADAARGAGLSRAAARRCLLTLTELGYLAFDGKHFNPTVRLQCLGGGASRADRLAERAGPILRGVRDRLEESISLAVLDGDDALFIARAEAARIVSTGVRLGSRLPACATAAGRLLLGGMSDDALRDYLARVKLAARTQRSVIDRGELFRIIAEARHTGVCINDEELELGMRAMAVAVPGPTGILAAISMSTLTVRATCRQMETSALPVLREAAGRLSSLVSGG